MGILDAPVIPKDKKGRRLDTFAVADYASTLKGSARIRAMAATPPYAAPVMAVPAVVTESTTRLAANTVDIGYNHAAFRWPGFVDLTAGAANPRGNTRSDNGTRKSSVPYTTMSFDYDGPTFDILYKPSAVFKYRIWVNEQAHSAGMVTVVTTGASQAYLQVNLNTASVGAPRRIVVEMECDPLQIVFYGIKVPPTYSVLPPSTTSPRAMIVGDSYTLGVGATCKAYGYAPTLGRMMGWAETWTAGTGVPSTGFVTAASASDGPFIDRLAADVIAFNPDILYVPGSINDRASAGLGTIGPAVQTYVNTFRAAKPGVPVILGSPLFVANPIAADLTIRDEIKAAALTLGVPYIDLFTPVSFSGSGKSGAKNNTGNADWYCGGVDGLDGTHPTNEGHYMLASILAPRLRTALGLID